MYGLAGWLTKGLVCGASSRGSRAETSVLVGAAAESSSETPKGYDPWPLTFGDSKESRSIGYRRALEDTIEAVSRSLSSALTDVRSEGRRGELL